MGNANLTDSPLSRSEVLQRAVGKCPEMTVSIEGMPCTCLIDTGSEVSTVTESFFNNLLQGKPPLVDEHAFPPTGFAVAWLGCSLHNNQLFPIRLGFKCQYMYYLNYIHVKYCELVSFVLTVLSRIISNTSTILQVNLWSFSLDR